MVPLQQQLNNQNAKNSFNCKMLNKFLATIRAVKFNNTLTTKITTMNTKFKIIFQILILLIKKNY